MGRHHFAADSGTREFGSRRNRGGFGPGFGPGFGGPPWLAEMFNQAGGRGRHGFGGPGGPGRGRGPRVRRGDVRAAILDVLAEDRGEPGSQSAQPLNGYGVIQRIAEKTQGVWKPSPGSVYPTVSQLEDEELVVQSEGSGRKTLSLTDAGRAYVAEHPDEMAAVWAPFAEERDGDDGGDLRKVIGQTMAAVWQLASTGTTAQVEEAAVVLAETRRKLYTILAEGDASSSSEDEG